MPRILRSGLVALALLLSLLVGPAVAGAAPAPGPGNSPAAKACQNGGYVNYVRTDGTAFANEGDCVSYVARGGALAAKPTLAVDVTQSDPYMSYGHMAQNIYTIVTGYTVGDTICFQYLNAQGSIFTEFCRTPSEGIKGLVVTYECYVGLSAVRVVDVTTGEVVTKPLSAC